MRPILNTYKHWWFIAALLVIGSCIYILFRQNVLIIEILFGVKEGILCHLDLNHPLLYFIVYCLPDGLWYFALLHTNKLIVLLFDIQNKSWTRTINLMVLSAPFVLEIGQLTGHFIGTFDIWDILTYSIILFIYFLWENSVMEYKY